MSPNADAVEHITKHVDLVPRRPLFDGRGEVVGSGALPGVRSPGANMPVDDIIGRWNIYEMQLWRREDIDLMGPAHIEFTRRGGSLGFNCVTGDVTWSLGKRGRTEIAKFRWVGNDEMDEASGTGWAAVKDGEMHGVIAFDNGDKSAFKARRFGSFD